MCLILTIAGWVGMVAAFFLAKALSGLGVIVAGIILLVLYLYARKHGNRITPGMELISQNAVTATAFGLLAGLCYYRWNEPILRFVHALFR